MRSELPEYSVLLMVPIVPDAEPWECTCSESVASMYEDALNGANMDFLPYEALVPVLAAIEMRTLVDAHNKKTKESNWGMTPLGEYPH